MYESVLVPHSSLKCNSKFPVAMLLKFPVRTRNFQLECRNFQFEEVENFQFEEVEISSSNSKFTRHSSGWTKWKFPVRTRSFQLECRNFQFEEVEISSWDVEISSSNSKFPVGQSGNFQFELEISSWNVEISSLKKSKLYNQPTTRNFDFVQLEISSSKWKKWKFRLPNWKFRLRQTGNFDIPTGNFEFKLEISTSANWKFRHPNRQSHRVRNRNE